MPDPVDRSGPFSSLLRLFTGAPPKPEVEKKTPATEPKSDKPRIILPHETSNYDGMQESKPKTSEGTGSEVRRSEFGGRTPGEGRGPVGFRSSFSSSFTPRRSALEAATVVGGSVGKNPKWATPKNPKLFAGAKVVVEKDGEKPKRGTFVGYDSGGDGWVKGSSGVFEAKGDIKVQSGQTYISPADELKPNQIYKPTAAEKRALDALLNESVGSNQASDYVDVIQDAGFEAYVVGGAVRDALQKTKPNDVDLSTTMWVGDVSDALRPTRLMGGSARSQYGTLLVGGLDICSLKAGGKFGFSLKEDVKHRDFTINALFYDPANGVILDPNGTGVEDAKSKTLRPSCAKGQEAAWIRENPSAVLRLVKFTLRGYTPDPKLLALVKKEFDSSMRGMGSWRVDAMKKSMRASRSEVRAEMKKLGFTESQINKVYSAPSSFFGGSSSRSNDSKDSDRPRRFTSSNDAGSGGGTRREWVQTGPGRSRLVTVKDDDSSGDKGADAKDASKVDAGKSDAPPRTTFSSNGPSFSMRSFAARNDLIPGRPNAGSRNLAVARGHLGHISLIERSAADDLEKAGFKKVKPGHYEHADKSWVRFESASVYRGIDNIVFQTIPDGPGPKK